MAEDSGLIPTKDRDELDAWHEENQGEYGSPASGFADDGPFSCMDCIHRTPHSYDKDGNVVDSCRHPKVMSDPKLKDRKLPDGTIGGLSIRTCCEFVWPKPGEGDQGSNEYGEGGETNDDEPRPSSKFYGKR